MNQRQPQTLEEYVTLRYAEDLNKSGYQPLCEEAEELLQDSMEMMARLNMVTQQINRRVGQNNNTNYGQASA